MKLTGLLLSLALGFPALQATILYDNFNLGDTFDPSSGATVSNSSSGDRRASFSFVSAASYRLTSIDFVTSLNPGSPLNQVMISISADQSGHPGAALESMTFTNAMGFLAGSPAPPELHFISAANPTLTGGVTYWITADGPNDFASTVVWNFSTIVANTGTLATFSSSTMTWSTQNSTLGVFRVNGDNAPEPGTLVLLGGGVALMAAFRRRRNSHN